MNVHEWTPVTRDWVRLENITVDGEPVDPADLTVGLLPVRTPPSGTTTWTATTPHPDDAVPSVRIAGKDADPTSALVLTDDAVLHGRVVKNGTVVTAPLARLTYSG